MELAFTSVPWFEAGTNGPAIHERCAGSGMICRAGAKPICNFGQQRIIGHRSAMLRCKEIELSRRAIPRRHGLFVEKRIAARPHLRPELTGQLSCFAKGEHSRGAEGQLLVLAPSPVDQSVASVTNRIGTRTKPGTPPKYLCLIVGGGIAVSFWISLTVSGYSPLPPTRFRQTKSSWG